MCGADISRSQDGALIDYPKVSGLSGLGIRPWNLAEIPPTPFGLDRFDRQCSTSWTAPSNHDLSRSHWKAHLMRFSHDTKLTVQRRILK
jgi:hypothetical protein